MPYVTAVVGGGIAGATAVIALARAGFSTLWLRPDPTECGDKVGESLAPAANTVLSKLGLSHLLAGSRHRQSNATFSAWGQQYLVERNAAVHLEGPGFVLDRPHFERELVESANKVCDLIIPAQLTTFQAEDCGWSLQTDAGQAFRCQFLVDASGRSQRVASSLSESWTDDKQVAAYSFLPHCDPAVEPTPATLIESVVNGWWYAALLPDHRLVLNYYSDANLMPKGLAANVEGWHELIEQTIHIAHWLEDAGFDSPEGPKLASAATRGVRNAAGLHLGSAWAAIGDAAAALDPLSAHGMTTAIWAGARMPQLVAAWERGDESELAAYARSVAEGVDDFRGQRRAIYARERRFPQSSFWARRRLG